MASRLIQWRYVLDKNSGASFADADGFLKNNPDWPLRDTMFARAEAAIDLNMTPSAVIAWFGGRAPVTGLGMIRLGDAMMASGNPDAGRNMVQRGWVGGNFELDQELAIVRKDGGLFTPDVDKLIIDSRPEYDRIKKFIAAFMPDFAGQIELYTSAEPIFDGYGIEIEIDRALERKVWLKSGGYLIVDEMEALTAIDVNTGRFVGKRNLEDTITQTNMEAAREVAEQLRIRSIGGMIVVDFIDMDRSSNRNKITRAFNDFLRRDRAKAAVTRISELGLVEMTRKRTRESLLHDLTEPCEHCEGKGYTKSRRTVAYGLLRELRRQGNLIEGDTVMVEVHPDVAQVLAGPEHIYLEEIEKRLQKRIIVKARGSFAIEDFELHSPGQKALEHSESNREERDQRRSRRRKKVGPPAEVQAMMDEEERNSLGLSSHADAESEASEGDEDGPPSAPDSPAAMSSDAPANALAPEPPVVVPATLPEAPSSVGSGAAEPAPVSNTSVVQKLAESSEANASAAAEGQKTEL